MPNKFQRIFTEIQNEQSSISKAGENLWYINILSKEFHTALKENIPSLNDQGLSIILSRYQSILVDATPVGAGLSTLISHLNDSTYHISTHQKRLFVKTILAAIDLKDEPSNLQAYNDFDDCYKQISKYRIFHKIAAAMQHFLASFAGSLTSRANVNKIRANLHTDMAAFRNELQKPMHVYTFPGQHQALIDGANACASVALSMATEISHLSNDEYKQLAENPSGNKIDFGKFTLAGVKLNKAISTGFFSFYKRLKQKSVAEVEENLETKTLAGFEDVKALSASKVKNPLCQNFPPSASTTTAFPLRTVIKAEQGESKSRNDGSPTLSQIIDDAETSSENVAFVATASHIKKADGHINAFFSRIVDGKRVYAIADSRHPLTSGKFTQGSLKIFNNRAAFEHSLLSTWRENKKHDAVSIDVYSGSPRV